MNRRFVSRIAAPLLAGGLAFVVGLLFHRGADLPAQIYRIGLFHREGFTLWDSQWYGGHWTLDYSVLFPPVAGILGIEVAGAAAAAAAAWAFDRLVVDHFGAPGRVGAVVFAVGTIVQVSMGQLPFLLGEALALCACLAARRGRFRLGMVFAALGALSSPLAGAFLALVVISWLVTAWPRARLQLTGLAAATVVPLAVVAASFRGEGPYPFPVREFLVELLVVVGVSCIVPRREGFLRMGVAGYGVALTISFALPTPVGANVVRLGECLAIPLAVCLLWPVRRRLLLVAAVPLAVVQWGPAWAGALVVNGRDASTHRAYFQPLVDFVARHADPAGRLEIVPTRLHWEAAYVAPTIPLARGWERQLDTANNQIFYADGQLSGASYHAWLLDNGVRFVALPDVTLDYAAVDEAQLVASGFPGLQPVLRTRHWQVFEVVGSPGIVTGPARLVSLHGGQMVLDVARPGPVLVRVRNSPHWSVFAGEGCVHESDGTWTLVEAHAAGVLRLHVRLQGTDQELC